MKTLNQLKAIAKSAGYKLKFTGNYDSNGIDKLYSLYVGNTRQEDQLTISELNNRALFN